MKVIHEVSPQNLFKGAMSSFGVVCKAIQGKYRTETWQFFSRMFVMAINKELFTPTYNRIAVSLRCVSSLPVVRKAKLPGQL